MNIAVLLLKCKNEARVTTLTRDQIQVITAKVAGFLFDQSGGRELLEFRVFDWFELSLTGPEWNALQFNVGQKVVPEVATALNVDLSVYGHYVLLIDKADAFSAAWNTPGTLKYNHMAAQTLNPAIMAHELGHMYGSGHANLDRINGPLEYGDQFCIMGNESNKYTFIDDKTKAASGPGMVAPNLIACNWLDLNQKNITIDVRKQLNLAPHETTIELSPLQGTPPINYAGLPVVALGESFIANQKLLIEFRTIKDWDRGMPKVPSPNGWVLAHLTNGAKPGANSLRIGAMGAKVDEEIYIRQSAVTIKVKAFDANRNTVTLKLSRLNPMIRQVFSGGDGVIYVIMDNGDLMWYRHDGRVDGSFRWADNNPRKVGAGWNFKQVFSGGDGVIYAITDTNDLLWFRHDGRGDGSFKWADDNA